MKRDQLHYKSRVRALEIPKVTGHTLQINQFVIGLFERLKTIRPLLAQKQELIDQLFYVEKSLAGNLSHLSSLMAENIKKIKERMRY